MKELKVKVGDKILYRVWGRGQMTERIETVKRVTPTGRIRIEGCNEQYDKYGREMGNSSSLWSSALLALTEEDCRRIEKQEVIQKALSIIKNMNEKTLSYEQALKILEILDTE